MTQIAFLGHEVTDEGIQVDPKKMEAIVNWEPPRKVTGVGVLLN